MNPATLEWPDPAETSYIYRGKGRERPRYMKHHRLGWERPGVTTVLGSWDKGGLVNWAANVEREACLEASRLIYEEVLKTGFYPEPTDFEQRIHGKLGAARSHQRQKDKAADIGTGAHDMAEWRLRKELGIDTPEPAVSDESLLAYMAFEDHWKQAGLTILRIEQPVWSDVHEYAGTADLICLRDGKLGVVDLKSSKNIYPSMHMQVAAYCNAIEEMMGGPVEWAELWRMPKTLENLNFEVQTLGEMRVWGGDGFVTKQATSPELLDSFLGIKKAWETTVVA